MGLRFCNHRVALDVLPRRRIPQKPKPTPAGIPGRSASQATCRRVHIIILITSDLRESSYYNTSDLRDITSDLREITSGLREITSDLREITSDLWEITSDLWEITSDLRFKRLEHSSALFTEFQFKIPWRCCIYNIGEKMGYILLFVESRPVSSYTPPLPSIGNIIKYKAIF